MKHFQKWFELMAGISREEMAREELAREIFAGTGPDTPITAEARMLAATTPG